MEEIKDRAEFWIRIEEQSKVSGDPIPLQGKAEDKLTNKGSNPRNSFVSRSKDKEPRGTFNSYTPLLTMPARLYKEVMNTELTERPPVMRSQSWDRKKWCEYHQDHGHYTNKCIKLKDAIERLVRRGKLKEFVQPQRESRNQQRSNSPRNTGREVRGQSPWQRTNEVGQRGTRSRSPHLQSSSQPRGVINVIAGGIVTKSKRSRTERELCAQVTPMPDVVLSFTKADFPVGKIRENELLVITAMINDFEVH
jgi:hypothetical protein